MGFVVIHPEDDAAAEQAAKWCSELVDELVAAGHELIEDVNEQTPADSASIEAALEMPAELVCYFGHGTPDSWQTDGQTTIESGNVGRAAGKTVVSIACLTGRNLGPDAVTAGVSSWLGITIKVPVLPPHKNVDPMGSAFVSGLRHLSRSATIGDVRDSLIAAFEQLAVDYDDGGRFAGRPDQPIGYYGAHALKDSIEVSGRKTAIPLP